MIDNKSKYWDSVWEERVKPDGTIKGNGAKVEFLINELWSRPYLVKATKLEIGCGPATHVTALCNHCSEWGNRYWGIDPSKKAVGKAKTSGLRITQTSINDFKTEERFDAFLFMDVLEHIEDHGPVAQKVKSLSAEKSIVLINVPLYRSHLEEKGGFERDVDINTINTFMYLAGFDKFNHKIYGLGGYPHMFAEGFKS